MQKVLNIKEAADYLGYTVGTLYNLTSRRAITHSKVGRYIKFKKKDLDSFIESRTKLERSKTEALILSYKERS